MTSREEASKDLAAYDTHRMAIEAKYGMWINDLRHYISAEPPRELRRVDMYVCKNPDVKVRHGIQLTKRCEFCEVLPETKKLYSYGNDRSGQ